MVEKKESLKNVENLRGFKHNTKFFGSKILSLKLRCGGRLSPNSKVFLCFNIVVVKLKYGLHKIEE